MIEIEVLSSPDHYAIGRIQFQKNLIYIGRKSQDLPINEAGIIHQHLMLEVLDDMILLHASPLVNSFLVNGKITKKIKPLKKGDVILIGKTEIKIIDAVYQAQPSIEEVKEANLEALLNSKHPDHQLLKQLNQMLKNEN